MLILALLKKKRHGPKKGPKDNEKDWDAWHEETQRELGLSSPEKRRLEEDLIIMFQYWKDG